MSHQSRSTQRQIIDTARKDGTLDNLYWYVCLDLPLKYGSIANPISSGAKWRGGVPVIRVAPDPAASEAEIELLRWLFEDGNRGQGIRFYYALTTKSLLDAICRGGMCGATQTHQSIISAPIAGRFTQPSTMSRGRVAAGHRLLQ